MSIYTPPADSELQDGLSLLQDHLPSWWRKDDPTSSLYGMLVVLAVQLDLLSALYEDYLDDQVLINSTLDGLQRTWEPLWGVQGEQLQQEIATLVPYIQARMAEDGSVESLLTTLLALVLAAPVNRQTGPVVTFASDGSGITLPASGVTLWEWDGATYPLPGAGMIFPANGSGIPFPLPPLEMLTDSMMADDGTVGISQLANYPLVFTDDSYVVILQDFPAYATTVQVKSALTFDRGAFSRAVQRFRQAHTLPPVIQEVP